MVSNELLYIIGIYVFVVDTFFFIHPSDTYLIPNSFEKKYGAFMNHFQHDSMANSSQLKKDIKPVTL